MATPRSAIWPQTRQPPSPATAQPRRAPSNRRPPLPGLPEDGTFRSPSHAERPGPVGGRARDTPIGAMARAAIPVQEAAHERVIQVRPTMATDSQVADERTVRLAAMLDDRCLSVRGTPYSIVVLKVTDTAGEPDGALMFPAELSRDLAGMLDPRCGHDYYLFSLGVVAGRLSCSAFSHFIGWANDRKGWELRVPSLVNPSQVLKIRDAIPCLVVEGTRQFSIWNALGGHALVERRTTEEFMPDMLEPMTCAPDASGSGFVGVSSLTEQELQYAPSRRLRMQILLRDNNRCRSCGRSPSTNPDVELHVHHVRPWGIGGLTHPLNLVTLCQTCHRGLPGGNGWAHYEPKLYELVPGQPKTGDVSQIVIDYRESVLQYRQAIAKIIMSADTDLP